MLIGVIICLISVILLGIDGRFASPTVFPQVQKDSNSGEGIVNEIYQFNPRRHCQSVLSGLSSEDVAVVPRLYVGLRSDVQ